jgi:hypothetical protein
MVKITLILYEMWRSLSLDQIELNILGKWSRLNHNLDSLILIDLTLTKIGTFLVIVDKGGEVSHKDIERGRESKRYDIGKGSIKIEHTSRGSKLMNHVLHLYVHYHDELLHCKA